MSDCNKEWDQKMAAQKAERKETKKDVLELLLREMKLNKCAEVYQVEELINRHLSKLDNKLNKEV